MKLIGLVVFPDFTALDVVGPYEVLGGLKGAGYEVVWVAESLEPVVAHQGLILVPQFTFDDAPDLDIVLVSGGPGYLKQMENPRMIEFLQRASKVATVTGSICTGSLILAAAGLLKGKRATGHWAVREDLAEFGATPVDERVVIDGDVITAAGVSAGIDMALTLAAQLAGPEYAMAIQLNIEYDPQPPFNAGTPEKAPPEILRMLKPSEPNK